MGLHQLELSGAHLMGFILNGSDSENGNHYGRGKYRYGYRYGYRLVPSFQKKAGQISNARECIGKSITGVSVYQKSENAMVIVSALTSWTLEGGITMADSMKSRGFGSGNRTTFSVYRIRKLDKWLIFLMILIEIIIVISAFKGGMKVSYVPELEITYLQNPWTVIGSICYGTFLSIPTVLHIVEEMTWCILKSKI